MGRSRRGRRLVYDRGVRRLFRWAVGIASALAIWKLWRRRTAVEEPQAPAPDPADELRRKLSETRAAAGADPAMTPERASEPAETLDERRSRVHEKAQQAIQAMQEPPA